MSAMIVEMERISKRYGRQVALDNVSLAVPAGVVFALLGENGAGKTTAIRVMLGLTQADAGRCSVLGLDSDTQHAAIRRRIGYVAERPTLYEWMTVAEIGWFTAGFYASGFQSAYRKLAERFELPPDRKIAQLSKGMRAKVVLSLAMAHGPELLILDEPTSGLDPLVRREFLEGMVDVAAAGRTVLLSSHQIGEVERVADIVAILHEGRLVLAERLDDLKQQVREVTITLRNGAAAPPPLPGQVVSQRRHDRHWQILVRGADDEQLAAVQADESVGTLDVRVPGLEDIFVAYMQKSAADRGGAAV